MKKKKTKLQKKIERAQQDVARCGSADVRCRDCHIEQICTDIEQALEIGDLEYRHKMQITKHTSRYLIWRKGGK